MPWADAVPAAIARTIAEKQTDSEIFIRKFFRRLVKSVVLAEYLENRFERRYRAGRDQVATSDVNVRRSISQMFTANRQLDFKAMR